MRISYLIVISALIPAAPAQAFDLGGMLKNAVEEAKGRVVQETVDTAGETLEAAFPSLPDGILSVDSEQLGISDGGVVLYETDSCPYCIKARRYLQSQNVRYQSRNVGSSKSAQKEFKKLGGRGVPMILVDDQRLTGWSQSKLSRMLKEAGYL